MLKSHEHKGMNNASKNKNGLPNVMPTILCFLSLTASATVEKKLKHRRSLRMIGQSDSGFQFATIN